MTHSTRFPSSNVEHTAECFESFCIHAHPEYAQGRTHDSTKPHARMSVPDICPYCGVYPEYESGVGACLACEDPEVAQAYVDAKEA